MRTSTFSTRTFPWLLALSSSLLIAACGGSKDPILGVGQVVTLAPSVSATAPLASNPVVTGVASNTRVTATFNKPMSPTSLNSDTFNLQCPAGVNTVGSVDYDASSRVATLTPTANLPAGTRCTATVTTGAQDTNGTPLTANYTWAFVTGSSSDITRPTVTQQVPAQDAVAATNTQLIATFSEEMTPSSLNAVSFTLKTTTDNTPVQGTVSYAVGARTATFIPTNPALLLNNTSFTATISTAAIDLAGNAMLAPKVWSFTTAQALDTSAPTVTLVNPAEDSSGVCINKTVNATFSESMAPSSLTSNTLTLAPSSSLNTPVAAVITYDAQTRIASINPSANLTASTAYTATVLGGAPGAKDLAGNALQVDKVWRFTTGASECQSPVALGSASNFAILGSAAITNIPTSLITGDVGLTPDTGANITGFSAPLTCPEVVGRIYAVDSSGPACALVDAVLLSNAKTDALAAFTNATGAARGTPIAISTNLEGLTFYPGLYQSLTTIDLSAGGILTLDAQGDPNAVFVIRSATAINALSTSQVVLSGGAKASNVFWSAGSAITLGVNSVMKGSLLASTAITLQTGAQLEGRALNQGAAAAAITCDACTITVPSP
jgi:hypothetical protein